jgi:hypothetical protein
MRRCTEAGRMCPFAGLRGTLQMFADMDRKRQRVNVFDYFAAP